MSLPVEHLSASSIRLYLSCPEKWRRRYIEREYEQPTGAMVLGGAVHAALAQADHAQLEADQRSSIEETLDVFGGEWDDRSQREEIRWDDEPPGALKDAGAGMVSAYERGPGARLEPIAVETRYALSVDGVSVVGYTDVEEPGRVVDRKTTASRYSSAKAAQELQPTIYLAMQRAASRPANFHFHTLVRTKKPYAEVVPTLRTDAQLDGMLQRISLIAEEIEWRTQTGNWQGAAPGWWGCAPDRCGYWHSCPFGAGIR